MTDILETPATSVVDPRDQRLADKDAHIGTLESELADLRADARARASLEELINSARQAPPAQTRKDEPQVPQTIPEDLETRVQTILSNERAKANKESNLEKVRSALTAKYGEDYNAILQETARSLGVAEKWIADMAASAPDGLLALVQKTKGEARPGAPSAPPASSVDTSKAFNQGTKKNYAYFDAIRKADLNKWLSRAVQGEMHDEAVRQGGSFYE